MQFLILLQRIAERVLTDPNNNFVFIADLGIDQLVRYKLDGTNGRLIPAFEGNVKMEAGSGPRHFVFHPSGKFVYILSELLATVTALSYDAASGMMQKLQVDWRKKIFRAVKI